MQRFQPGFFFGREIYRTIDETVGGMDSRAAERARLDGDLGSAERYSLQAAAQYQSSGNSDAAKREISRANQDERVSSSEPDIVYSRGGRSRCCCF